MARPVRIEFPGAIYHVTSRMIGSWLEGKERLYRGPRDYARFLERLEERVRDFEIRLYLFCLMSNHFHLVLETPQGNVSRFMQSLATAYTVYYNRRHQRRRNAFYRAMASKCLARYAGLTQREIAEGLGMGTGAAVSAQMKRWTELGEKDRRLGRQMRRIERALEGAREWGEREAVEPFKL